ncbi:hypothetical protein A9P82_08770 [Arachidicoccus ginsenosidimutans]|uniref:hypothetical protein n=1 Tax=Arachidicoccus sp. BS20 TaxID=1850526 RepID=UPI0007F093C4|nr:hypothetical protein [Arachidicoccus sp. BS20]ANI89375.1 hypothetical protein A9P82_08770 [Arachidicoccus sp. BS20]
MTNNLINIESDQYLHKVYFFIGAATLILMVAFVYSPVSYLSFSGPDDHWMLLKNPYIKPAHYDWAYFNAIFHRVNNLQYSPLNTLYYSFIYKINGFDPYYFHVMNIIIHFLSTISVFYFAKNILIAFKIDNILPISFLTAMIWGIHPLNVEAVAWISGSKILICTLLTIVSFNLFIVGYTNKQIIKQIGSLLLFIISFFFKEQAIITPIMYLIFILCYKLNESGKLFFTISEITFLAVSFIISYFFIRITIQVNYGPALEFPPIKYYPLIQKFLLICYCAYFYISNFFFPSGLHYNYQFPFDPYDITPPEFKIYPFIILVIVVAVFYSIKKSKNQYFNIFCIFLCIVQISLELQILPMTRPAVVADRYMYFPLIPLIMTMLVFLFKFKRNKAIRQILDPIFIIYILYLSLYCYQMANYWQHLNLIKS